MSSNRGTKQLEKLMAQEAKTDQKFLQRAVKEYAKAEKAHKESAKASEKAFRESEKLLKRHQKTFKSLHQAQHKHADAEQQLKHAEIYYQEKHEQELSVQSEVEQLQVVLSDVYHNKVVNDQDRENQLASACGTITTSRLSQEGTSRRIPSFALRPVQEST